MLVYDVITIIEPGAPTSDPPGRWLVYFFTRPGSDDPEQDAYSFRDVCRNCCGVPGIRYEVEEHDEESPARANYKGDRHQ